MLAPNSPQKGPSHPCRWLSEQERLVGPVLDWGCGNGDDVVFIRNAYGYDPQHQPYLPEEGELFNTILCTYMVDDIPNYHDRCVFIREALDYLAIGGWLYVSNRQKACKEARQQLYLGGFTLICQTEEMEIWGWQKTPE